MNNFNYSLADTLSSLDSLIGNLLLLLSEKEKFVVKKRFNLDGKGRSTLEEIGREFSVTRERVRQIEKNALNKMQRNVFNTSLKELHNKASVIIREHGGLIKSSELVSGLIKNVIPRDELSIGAMDLALNLYEDVDCIGNTINFYPYVRSKDLSDSYLKTTSNCLLNQMRKHGDVRAVDKIYGSIKSVADSSVLDVSGFKSLIDIDKRMLLLDDDFIALMEWRHINPRTLRDKILYVLRNAGEPMHFSDISEKIDKNNFDNKKINLQAVHNELIRYEQFVLIGRGIYALKEWGYESGTVADVIESALREKKELSQDEIVDIVLKKRQVKRITVILSLKNNDKFLRLGRKHYKLKV